MLDSPLFSSYNSVRRKFARRAAPRRIEVHPRVRDRHPELSDDDVRHAWRNALAIVERSTSSFPDIVLVAVGSDAKGRLVEMVAAVLEDGGVHVFHAMTPPSKKTLRETGIGR